MAKYKAIISCISIITIIIFWQNHQQYYFGPKSDHFNGKRFFDPYKKSNNNLFRFLKWQLTRTKVNWPKKIPITPIIPVNRITKDHVIKTTYIGHATFLIQTKNANILTDPIWSNRASPVSFIGPQRISIPGVNLEDLPPIDIIIISHNHYDHLDLITIKKLWDKHKPIILVPLGNDSTIKAYDKNIKTIALDWQQSFKFNQLLTITLTPAQHWSARGILDKNKALWGSFIITDNSAGNIYFSGDTGYGNGIYFQQALNKYHNFKLAILPIGAYKPRWFMQYSHMNPKEALQAMLNLNAEIMIPSHYNTFKLADVNYNEALKDLNKAQNELNIKSSKIKVLLPGQYYIN